MPAKRPLHEDILEGAGLGWAGGLIGGLAGGGLGGAFVGSIFGLLAGGTGGGIYNIVEQAGGYDKVIGPYFPAPLNKMPRLA